MRYLATPLLLLLTAVCQPVFAQTTAVAPAAGPANTLATARYSPADTIRAVRNLFGLRSKGALGYTAAGSAVLAEAAVTTALRPPGTSTGQRIDTNRDWLFGSAMMGYGLLRTKRFGKHRGEQIIAAYEQGEPLPSYVRRRLKPKYFRYRPF
ncbi:hypothetical protein [Hymenobacter koreensis]|uniref:Uncharacterized protein n=1 Tax=Hymenobacter koreensis TaxID=1084523 RepID=A0ABP8IU42_9BACT